MTKWIVGVAMAVVLGVPFVFRPERAIVPEGAERVVIITPHNEQIRSEFGRAFDRWHREKYGSPAAVVWQTPGGTSAIRRQLQAIYGQAIGEGRITAEGELAPGADAMPFDLMFGGGSYEFDVQLKGTGATGTPPGGDGPVTVSITQPLDFDSGWLAEMYGENRIGTNPLYDPDQHWIGTAVSGFGIVFNRDLLKKLGVEEPDSWEDLADPRLRGWLALADPRHSGSVSTTYDAILNNYGWEKGWRVLRGMAANARYFANEATKIPIDVSQGEAAVGLAIDFYGRYQSQAVMRPGESAAESRVGYVDPPGEVYIDPDPVAMLRGAPNPEIAKRFIEFCISAHGQALWQFEAGAEVEDADEGLVRGPVEYELRRMPARRVMYERHAQSFVDKDVRPFEAASDAGYKGWRSAIAPIMKTACITIHDEQGEAWEAMEKARERGVDDETLIRAERAFFAMPVHQIFWQAEGDEFELATVVVGLNGSTFRRQREPLPVEKADMPGITRIGDSVDVVVSSSGIEGVMRGRSAEHVRFQALRGEDWLVLMHSGPTQYHSAEVFDPRSKELVAFSDLAATLGIRDHLWDQMDGVRFAELEIAYTAFFRDAYDAVEEMLEGDDGE